ncbi:MAG: LemA family protein [Candidatus Magnetoovum sp. WYHC-5]|nr:LemA family protein [Candidatus Magnetoovum sp. WYHC-5]
MKTVIQKNMYIVAFLTGLCFLSVILRLSYNKYIDRLHFLEVAYDNLEVEIQRRHDIITRNLAVVRKYLNTERQIIDKLVTLNGLIENNADEAQQEHIKHDIITLLNRVNILLESYPDIKASSPYEFFIQSMKYTSLRITNKRNEYNAKVHDYNTFCRMFPYKNLTVFYGCFNIPFFEATLDAKKMVSVNHLLNSGKETEGDTIY